MPDLEIDPVPFAQAGVRTVACECGWEAVFIQPEEDDISVVTILAHLREAHNLTVPVFTVTVH